MSKIGADVARARQIQEQIWKLEAELYQANGIRAAEIQAEIRNLRASLAFES